jgi:RNA polymerase subunit RPABC4/transcription elongation factor Spt4
VSSPSKIYITTNRVLFKSTGAFGLKAKIIDVRYEEIATVMLKRGVFSTEIMLKPRSLPGKIVLPAVDKQVALQVSAFIQKGMRKELAGAPARKEQAPPRPDPLVKLERLAEMKREGTITDAEFQILKEEMMLTLKPEIGSGEPAGRPAFAGAQAFKHPPAIEPRPPAPQPAPVQEKPREEQASCRYCSSAVPRAAKFCPECGKELQLETNIWKMCPSCDALASNDAVFCTSCNQRFPETLS